MQKNIKYVILVLLILALGAFIRFWSLDCYPPGLYPDEAVNATDGLGVAENGGWLWFYENNNGREGLYLNLLGYLLVFLGPKLWVLRLLPALIGFLTLPAVYWLGKRWIGNNGAVISLALVAFSYWHLNFSRVGFRAILMVMLLAWAFAFLTEGLHRLIRDKSGHKYLYLLFFSLSGIFLGLSLHTYIAVRITPVVLIVLFTSLLAFFPKIWKKILIGFLIMSYFAFLTATPLLLDFIKSPVHFTGRTSDVSVMASGNVIPTLGKTIGLTLVSFVGYGDQNWRHNYPLRPIVFPFWGIVMLFSIGWGIYYVIKNIIRWIQKKDVTKLTRWNLTGWFFVLSWWAFFLLPSIMTNEGLPHALRSIGSLIPTYILTAVMIDKWSREKEIIKKFFITVIVLVSFCNVITYFFLFGDHAKARGAFEYRLAGIGAYLREEIKNDEDVHYYVVANQDAVKTQSGYPVSIETIRFFTWGERDKIKYLLPEDFVPGKVQLPAKAVIQKNDQGLVDNVKDSFPSVSQERVEIDNYLNYYGKDYERLFVDYPKADFGFTILTISD